MEFDLLGVGLLQDLCDSSTVLGVVLWIGIGLLTVIEWRVNAQIGKIERKSADGPRRLSVTQESQLYEFRRARAIWTFALMGLVAVQLSQFLLNEFYC